MEEAPQPLARLIARDGDIRWVAFALVFLALAGAAVLVAVAALLSVENVWVKIGFMPPLLLIPSFVIGMFLQRTLRALRQRLAVLRRLADHGVVLEARVESQDWTTDSEGDRFWTARYRYSYLGTVTTLTRKANWSGFRMPHPESLRLLVDPERPADTFVIGSRGSGAARIAALLNTIGVAFMIFWLAGWALLFFGGIREQSWGPLLTGGILLGLPLLWIVVWIVTSVISRFRSS